MKVSLIQMNSQPDRAHNLREAARLMREAVEEDGPDLIVLPEHFDWSGGTLDGKLAAADAIPGGEAYDMVRQFAADNSVWVHAGSILERIEGENRIYNTTVVFDRTGREVGRYRKIHLFDIVAPDGKVYQESARIRPGCETFLYEVEGFRAACAICYDLRFSSLFYRLAEEGADVFILPAAFTLQTGRDHWEVLCRARAIEFQAYVLACGQWGPYTAAGGGTRYTYGRSIVCDPWGQVIALASDGPRVVTSRIDRDRLSAVRAAIPMAAHRGQWPGGRQVGPSTQW